MNPLQDLIARRGRRGRISGPGEVGPRRKFRIKAPSVETAESLIDVLRNHGFPAELRSGGSKVVTARERCDAVQLDTALRAVQMWLLLDATPNQTKLRWGRRRLIVHRQIVSTEAHQNS